MHALAPPLALLGVHALALPSLAQSTLVVDENSFADYFFVQQAVDAAEEGDTILVRAGSYDPFTVDGKSLTVVAEGPVTIGAVPNDSPLLRVRNLAPDQTFRMRGFQLSKVLFGYSAPLIDLANNAGAVVLEELEIASLAAGGVGMFANQCDSVTLRECTLEGQLGKLVTQGDLLLGWISHPGLAGRESNLFLYDCDVTGGSSWPCYTVGGEAPPVGAGQPAVRLQGGSLLASGCHFAGGDASQIVAPCLAGGDGGLAVEVGAWQAGGAAASRLGNVLATGAPSAGTCGNPDGIAPEPVLVLEGSATTLPGTARSFQIDSPVAANGTTQLLAKGEPGDAVLMLYGLDVGPAAYSSPLGAWLHLAPPVSRLRLGQVPPSGVLDLSLGLGAPPSPLGSITLSVQGLFFGAGGVFEGGVTTVTVLGSGL